MISFVPEFEGEMEFGALPDDVIARIQGRVESGLLQPGSRTRADYRVRSADRDLIHFGAEGFLTAYNVGLNEVRVQRMGRDRLRYRVTYWRWTKTAVLHGVSLGVLLAGIALFVPGAQRDLAQQPGGALSAGLIAGFFCLVWPWILTAFHKLAAEQLLRRILSETVAAAPARAA